MKRIGLLFSFLLFTVCSFAQSLFLSPPVSTNIGTGNEITFTNPQPNFKSWRVRTPYVGNITVPSGSTAASWKLFNTRDTTDVVASGTDLTVEWTPTWQTDGNTYDLLVTATIPGHPYVVRIFPGEVTVYPPVPTSEDIDVSFNLASGGMGDHDGSWTDLSNIAAYNAGTSYSTGTNVKYNGLYYKSRVGSNVGNTPSSSPTQWKIKDAYVIRIYGTHTGSSRLLFYWYRSDDLILPVQFFYDNAVIRTSRGDSWRVANMYNTIQDGTAIDGTYGLDIGNSGSPGFGQRAVIDLVDNSQPTRKTHYMQAGGIKVDNGSQATGGTGFQVTTDGTGSGNTNNWDNYQALMFTIHNIYVTNTRDEGFYIFHTNDLDNDSPCVDCLFYNLEAVDCGNETIQYSSLLGSSGVFKSRFINPGINNNSVHRNAFQFGGGNINAAFFMNEIETSKNIFVGDNGDHGNEIFCFSNKITSTGRNASDGVNLQWGLNESTVYSSINARFKNNTIIIKGVSFTNVPFTLYKYSSTTTHDKLRFDGNLITTNTATTWEAANGWSTAVSSGQAIFDNQQFTNIATPLFVDYTTNDYHLSSTSSPAFRSRTITDFEHRMMAYDFEGYKYLSSYPVDGCHSGYELYTGN